MGFLCYNKDFGVGINFPLMGADRSVALINNETRMDDVNDR